MNPTPPRVQEAYHGGVAGFEINSRAIRGENDEGLMRNGCQKTVCGAILPRVGKTRDGKNPLSVNLFGEGGMNRETMSSEYAGKLSGSARIPLADARGARRGLQVCGKKPPLESLPDCTPRIAIMISSGFEDASRAVSKEMPPF